MAMNSMSGADAKRYVRAGQLAAVVLGVAAVSLWALDVPGMNSLPAAPVVNPAESKPAVPAAAAPTTPRVDPDGVAGLAMRLDEARVKEPVVAKAPESEPVPEAPAGPEWTYLGPIFESDRSLAVVSVDGRQKILPEGRKYGETTLVSVAAEQIVVEDFSGRRTISKSSRPAQLAVAWVNQPTPTGVPIAANLGGRGPGGMSPEVQARIRERMDRGGRGPGGGDWRQGNNNNNNNSGRNRGRVSEGNRAEGSRSDYLRTAVIQGLPPGSAPQTITIQDGDVVGAQSDADASQAGDGAQRVRPRRGLNN